MATTNIFCIIAGVSFQLEFVVLGSGDVAVQMEPELGVAWTPAGQLATPKFQVSIEYIATELVLYALVIVVMGLIDGFC